MHVFREQLRGATAIGFASRGFDGERVTREIRTLRAPSTDGDDLVEVMAVHFAPGERTSVHRHLAGQVLVVLDGTAQVVTETDRIVAGPGDVVVATPGEWHWHGAVGDEPMTHLAIHPQGPGLTERETAAPGVATTRHGAP